MTEFKNPALAGTGSACLEKDNQIGEDTYIYVRRSSEGGGISCFGCYANHKEPQPKQLLSQTDLLSMAKDPSVGPKAKAALITPHTAQAKTREAALQAEFWAIVVDHDHDNLSKAQIEAIYGFEGFKLAYLAFTTSSHTLEQQKWKVVIPLAASCDAQTFTQVSQGIAQTLGGDPAQARAQQGFYAPNKTASDAPYEFIDGTLPTYEFVDDTPPAQLSLEDSEHPFMVAAMTGWAALEAAKEAKAQQATIKPLNIGQTSAHEVNILGKINELRWPDLRTLLEQHGYKRKGKAYLSPSSSSGTAGVHLLGSGANTRVYSHHGPTDPLSAENHNGHALDVAGVLCVLAFNGDFAAMVREYAPLVDPEGQKQRQQEYMQQREQEDTLQALAKIDDDTGRPIPLITEQTEPQAPYPVAALGPILAPAALAIADGVQVPPSMAGQSILAAAALAAQGHANVGIDGREIPMSLFCLTVAESGDRKTGTDRQALLPHTEHQKILIQNYKEGLKEYQLHKAAYDKIKEKLLKDSKTQDPLQLASQLAALREPIKPALPYILVEEPTIEGLQKSFLNGQSSMGLFSDEGAQFFGGHSMKPENLAKTSAASSKLWDGGTLTRIRGAEGESASRDGCRLSVHMMMQPVIAKEVLVNPIMLGQGLWARFLLCWSESLAGTRFYQEVNLNNDPHIGRYRRRMTELLQTTPQPPEGADEPLRFALSVNKAAKDLWTSEYNRIESQLGRLGDLNGIKAVGSKAAEQVLRIAGVLATVEDKQEIDSDTMSCAIELGQWYLGEALRLCYSAQSDPDLVAAQKLIDWIHSKGWTEFDRNRLGKSGPAFARSAKQRDKLLGILVSARHLLPSSDSKNFKINPLSVADSADSAEAQQIRGFQDADTLRTTADDLRESDFSAKFPQASAKLPQTQTQQIRGLPQNPQNPQTFESQNLKSTGWEGTL